MEDCDDGNTDSNDGCSSECLQEECGNGVIEGDEECDDGSSNGYFGCTDECRIDYEYVECIESCQGAYDNADCQTEMDILEECAGLYVWNGVSCGGVEMDYYLCNEYMEECLGDGMRQSELCQDGARYELEICEGNCD